MQIVSSILFFLLLVFGIGYFAFNVKKLIRNIQLGRKIDRSDNIKQRLTNTFLLAFGQKKMFDKPIVGILHFIIYIGFFIINLEVIEIIIDGLFGTHRYVSNILGTNLYNIFTATLEFFALGVALSAIIFFIRRKGLKIPRFWSAEMKAWPKNDANWILVIEFVLMMAFFKLNASDYYYQKSIGAEVVGYFPVSTLIMGWFLESQSSAILYFIERGSWWFHIIGILFFLNYLYWSKHLHILLAFPNTFFGNLNRKGKLNNLDSVTKEVKLMLDPSADPFAAPSIDANVAPETFGAKDVFDLNRVQLLNAYTCTECGRCTNECPANITGKKLSPRAIMMKVRDRLEDVGKNIDKNKGQFVSDEKKLINDYISPEELWACTSCNACVEACPILIDPLSIIIDLRRYLVMEESAAPQELNIMHSNIENNGAPWPFSQQDRLNWVNEK